MTTNASFHDTQAALAEQIKVLQPHDGSLISTLPSVDLIRMSSPSSPEAIIYEPCIYFVAQGKKQAYLDGETYAYDALNYLVLTVPLPLTAHVIAASPEQPYLAMRLKIDPIQLAPLLSETPTTPPQSQNSNRGIFTSRPSPELAEAMLRLTKLLQHPAHCAVLGESISQEILYYVLCGEQGHLLRSFTQSNRHDYQIAKVIHYIQENYQQVIEVNQLAEIANMSSSSLHQHFKSVTHSSPVQYIKSIRLHNAKRLITDEAHNVSDAAFKVGYASPSQFSREYKRLFGMTPSQSVASDTQNKIMTK